MAAAPSIRPGFAGAAALHWLGNFPILLMAWNAGGLGGTFWTVAVSCWLRFYAIAALGLLAYFVFGQITPARILYGRRHCPECDADYDAPIFALNFGQTRFPDLLRTGKPILISQSVIRGLIRP